MSIGNIVVELPPRLNNPRNSEGAFIETKDGTILFAYSRYKGDSQEDAATADIGLLCSYDEGCSFKDKGIILDCEKEHAINIMSVSLLEMQNGDIGVFYLVRTCLYKLQMFLRRSSDCGATWSERVLCTPVDGFFVVNNDRVTRLNNGRIIIPAALHRAADGYFDSRSEVVYFYSDDDGYKWKEAKGKCTLGQLANCYSGLQEPGILELSPGVLWGWARTDLGRQYEMFSIDNGENWSACQPSRFTSPNSPLCMKRLYDDVLIAVWNPIPEYNGKKKDEVFLGGRTPLVMAISKDNGKTFLEPIIIEDEEQHGYCYCTIYKYGKTVLLAYCAGGVEDGSCLARLRVRRISMKELSI